jgi:hypothetical protein
MGTLVRYKFRLLYPLCTHYTYYAIRQPFANRRTRKSLEILKFISFNLEFIKFFFHTKYKIMALIQNLSL